ncbi:transcriptional regulator, IclR family [Tistlia consotensis]|uniref:Transcriptional regulator, IclR family n=1 Tax=Tistlia consotensis USBA 355 TaxID=560819 RepID=A0A1Y6BP14_9PROT|nr:IclR family transcriptional regulator [Tistlia consotensis]SMF22024.1 transcriptional regulator, IclR family [Tistlia consotensis USBA 355]SNR46368.1 transcriptional regulator, IclR family [Tistlia consotensis]
MTEQKVEAVERALALLECFDGGEESLSLAELARRSGLYKSTILRLAASLERFGYLVRRADGRYRLGPTLWRLGSLYRRSFDLAELIRPELKVLVEATGETASYYVREGDSRVCLYRHNSPKAIRHHLNEGQRLSLEGGAASKVLTTFWTPPEERPWAEQVRRDGYGVSLGERDPEIAAIAVPVFDRGGRLRGSLSISGLITRFDAGQRAIALEAMRGSAARLHEQLTERE